MRQWDLDTGAAHLRDATEELQIAWKQVGEYWRDSVSQHYGDTHLDPIGPAMKKSLDAITQMQQLLNQIYLDCES
jgi:hypothetical protein